MTMVEVDVILDMPDYCLSYNDAHDFMEKFVKKNRGKVKAGGHVVLSFRHTLHSMVKESFLTAVADYANANSHVTWSVSSVSEETAAMIGLLAPAIKVIEQGRTPYVRRTPLRF